MYNRLSIIVVTISVGVMNAFEEENVFEIVNSFELLNVSLFVKNGEKRYIDGEKFYLIIKKNFYNYLSKCKCFICLFVYFL